MEIYKDKEIIIIGYNTNWKTNVNMGRKNNRVFYSIPYRILINKLFTKAKKFKKKVVETNESYTSKCDSLNKEEICYHKKYDGERIKRGLFSSKKKKLLNADLNGAINIMRKYANLKEIEIKKIRGINICNPRILKIKHEVIQ